MEPSVAAFHTAVDTQEADGQTCLSVCCSSCRATGTVSAPTDTFQCKHSFPPTSRVFFFFIGQTGFHLNSNEWMSRMTAPECYPVTLSFKLFTTFSVCAFPMRTLSTKRLFITGIMHSVFAYAKREACRTGTAGSQRPSRNLHERTTKKGMNSQSPMKQNPEQTLFLLSSFHQLLSLRHSPC